MGCQPKIVTISIPEYTIDKQPDYAAIGAKIDKVIEENFDIVLGSRFMEIENNVPFLRKIILKGGVIFTYLVSNIKLSDTHNGFRALGRKAIDSIRINQRGMAHSSEIIDEIKIKGLKYKEVPVKILYTEYSKIKGQKSSNSLKIAIKILLRKLIG